MSHSPTEPARPERLVLLDAVRATAVVLALWVHAGSTFSIWPVLGRELAAIFRLVTMAGTPLFLVVFGATFECITWRHASRAGPAASAARMRRRGRQCYGAYAVTIAAGVAGGHLALGEGAAALAFLAESHFGNILKFYALELSCAGALLAARARLGVGGLLASAGALWLVPALLDHLVSWPEPTRFVAHLTAMFFGRPAMESPPSLLHGQVLVVAGIAIGYALALDRAHDRWQRSTRTLVLAMAACLAVIAVVLTTDLSPHTFLRLHIHRVLRSENHVGYYAISLIKVALIMLAFMVILRPQVSLRGFWNRALAFGRWPLLSYTVGNVLLNLWPGGSLATSTGSLVAVFGFPFVVAALVAAWERRWQARHAT